MKVKTNLLLLLIAAIPISGNATVTVTGDGLKIGSSNTIYVNGNAVLGYNNYVSQPYSLAIGAHNDLSQDDNDYGSFALGHHNYIHGYGSIVGGSYNSVSDNSSFTTGYYNHNSASASLVVGRGNVAEYNKNSDSITAGKYNAAVPNSKPAHLVIGNGTSSTNRNNSFVVYADGDIIITKPQGDISMGIYE